jgi:hypothetical protein
VFLSLIGNGAAMLRDFGKPCLSCLFLQNVNPVIFKTSVNHTKEGSQIVYELFLTKTADVQNRIMGQLMKTLHRFRNFNL